MEARKKRPRGFKKEAKGVQVSPLNPLFVGPHDHAVERQLATDDGLAQGVEDVPVTCGAHDGLRLRNRTKIRSKLHLRPQRSDLLL